MIDRVEQTEWCERVRAAIIAGNILEDPGYWRPHVEVCSTCRPRVEGLLTLRRLMERAKDEAPIRVATPEQGRRVMRAVFERFHRRRRRQRAAGLVAVLLAAGAGTFAWVHPGGRVEAARNPVAYAMELDRRIFPASGPHAPDLLKENADLRAEYVRALDNPSSLVRRTAMSALAMSGIDMDARRLETVIGEWSETLDSPVELAAAADGEASIRGALAVRRTATLHAALLSAYTQSGKGDARVSSTVLVGLLRNTDADIRHVALMSLARDPSFAPGEIVTSLFLHDPEAVVRTDAAECLVRRGGPKGLSTVIARLRSTQDFEVEQSIIPVLGKGADVLALGRDRVASAATPTSLALGHELNLVRAGERAVPSALVARAFAGGTDDVYSLAQIAIEADQTELRAPLQAAWLAWSPTERRGLGRMLARWDARTTDPSRYRLALDICEAEFDNRLREIVTALSRSEVPDVRERAQALRRRGAAK